MKVSSYDFLYQLTFLPHAFPVNCYIVEEEKELTLIDTALPTSDKAIVQLAEELKKPITKIVLTHPHSDHIGSLDKLKLKLPNAKVYISERDARILKGDHSIDKQEEPYPLKGGLPKNIRTEPDILVKNGDVIGSLTCISMPGHTPGSMAFWDKRSQILIAGDAFQSRGGFAISGQMRPWFPFPAWATWNKKEAINSAKKILDLPIRFLAVGHGKIVENPKPFISSCIKD